MEQFIWTKFLEMKNKFLNWYAILTLNLYTTSINVTVYRSHISRGNIQIWLAKNCSKLLLNSFLLLLIWCLYWNALKKNYNVLVEKKKVIKLKESNSIQVIAEKTQVCSNKEINQGPRNGHHKKTIKRTLIRKKNPIFEKALTSRWIALHKTSF